MTLTKKKAVSALAAVGVAAALALGGTFAWQSISQTALNEASDVVNPGGRLHDDFNGTNKDVYVENFADDQIFARVRLDEHLEFVMNKGVEGVEKTEVVTSYANEEGDTVYSEKGNVDTYVTHKFGEENATDAWWTWATGGSTIYMPTFNKNKDSLAADINGTYAGPDGEEATEDDKYGDYVAYADGETVDDVEIYDADANSIDEFADDTAAEGTNYQSVQATHTATATGDGALISMEEWKTTYGSEPGPYWVYDADGWVYWAQPIEGGTATGLLLDGIEQAQSFDNSWYYAINVVAQFVTADDLGRGTGTGFYDLAEGSAPSADALELLERIGVDVTSTVSDADALSEALAAGGSVKIDGEVSSDEAGGMLDSVNDYNFLMHDGGLMSGGTLATSNATFGLFVNNEYDWPEEGDGANAATIRNVTVNGDNAAAVYTQAIDAPVTLENVTITNTRIGLYAEYTNLDDAALGTVTLNNCTITTSNEADADKPWQNAAVAVAKSSPANGAGHVVINSGTYTGEYAAYVYSSGGTIEINGGTFNGKLANDGGALIIRGGTFTDDPTNYVEPGYKVVHDETSGTWTVSVDDMAGTLYAILTDDGSNAGTYAMTFVRFQESMDADSTYDGKAIAAAFEVDEENGYTRSDKVPWFDVRTSVTSVTLASTVKLCNAAYFFNGFTECTSINLSMLDTSEMWATRSMFARCDKLEALVLPESWDTAKVTTMACMFQNCESLTFDCSEWDVSSITEAQSYANFNTGATNVKEPDWNV